MLQEISVINKSQYVLNADVALMARACSKQLRRDVAPAWGRVSVPVHFYADESKVPASSDRIYLFDDLAQANALGYHEETPEGLPYGRVFTVPILNQEGSKLVGNLTISAALSHEVVELFCDPDVNCWFDGPGTRTYAAEACDPVEGDTYTVSVVLTFRAVSVSNFVLPAWFSLQLSLRDRFDFLGKLKRPFTITSDGYMIVRPRLGETPYVKYGSLYPEWKRDMKSHRAARTSRRARPRIIKVAN